MNGYDRPLGITILAIIIFLIGSLLILTGVATVFLGGIVVGFIGLAVLRGFIGGAIISIGVIEVILGIVNFIVGWGLIKGMNWARIIIIILSIASILGGIILLPTPLFPSGLLDIIISLAIIYYLTRPYVVRYFKQQA